MAAHDSGGAAARFPGSFQQTGDRGARGRRGWGRGKNLSYSGMTLKPFGRARLQRHPRPVVRFLQGYDGLFGPRPSDSIHLSG